MTKWDRAQPPLDDWLITWGVPHDFAGIDGCEIVNNVANFTTKSTGYRFTAVEPLYGEFKTLDVYRVTKSNGEIVIAATSEITPGVWATGIRDAESGDRFLVNPTP